MTNSKIFTDLETFYSKRSMIEKHKYTKSGVLIKCYTTTKSEGSFVGNSTSLTRVNKMFLNFLIKDKTVNVSMNKITGLNK